MAWDVDSSFIEDWLNQQDQQLIVKIQAVLDVLGERGPNLGRPLVDRIKGSRIHNLKELRIPFGQEKVIRILFVFDGQRKAVLLVAGDKASGGNRRFIWSGWYRKSIALAERRYTLYIEKKRERK